ncbi:MAG: TrmH family RNA methyltransferase [Treponemataceae bacterium]|nr:MAG: TrmH family RNA methyltransferase [Treponemataceae bacterium]
MKEEAGRLRLKGKSRWAQKPCADIESNNLPQVIPVYKLQKLPFSQKVRKIAKELAQMEIARVNARVNAQMNARSTSVTPATLPVHAQNAWITDAVTLLLAEDAQWTQAEKNALHDARCNPDERALSTMRHVLNGKAGGKIEADWDFIDRDGKPDKSKRRVCEGMQIFLEDIRSPFNIGSIFRSAENFGAQKIFLSPLCADPHHTRAERSAKGCISVLDYETLTLDALAKTAASTDTSNGTKIFALETGGTPVTDFVFPERAVMLVGNEELGLSPAALALADNREALGIGRVSIPMHGAKGSLNVSVSFGIVMHAWHNARRRR